MNDARLRRLRAECAIILGELGSDVCEEVQRDAIYLAHHAEGSIELPLSDRPVFRMKCREYRQLFPVCTCEACNASLPDEP